MAGAIEVDREEEDEEAVGNNRGGSATLRGDLDAVGGGAAEVGSGGFEVEEAALELATKPR